MNGARATKRRQTEGNVCAKIKNWPPNLFPFTCIKKLLLLSQK